MHANLLSAGSVYKKRIFIKFIKFILHQNHHMIGATCDKDASNLDQSSSMGGLQKKQILKAEPASRFFLNQEYLVLMNWLLQI